MEDSSEQIINVKFRPSTGDGFDYRFDPGQLTVQQLKEKLEAGRTETEAKRVLLDEKRSSTDKIRGTHLQTQRKQFDVEKNVAVAETSVHNLQRSIFQIENEQGNRSAACIPRVSLRDCPRLGPRQTRKISAPPGMG